MNARQHAAWLEIGGGNALIDGLLADRGLSAMPMGDTGCQMAGWFRKEVRNVGEFAGMKSGSAALPERCSKPGAQP